MKIYDVAVQGVYSRTPLYEHPLITDASLSQTVSLSLGKPLTFYLNSTGILRTPVNADNEHFSISCPINRYPKKVNLANADTLIINSVL